MAIVGKWLRKLGRSGRGARSTVKRLSSYISRKDLEQILFSTPDRRLVIKAVADRFAISEERLLEKLSADCGFEFVKRLPVLDETKLPPTLTIADLRRAGATLCVIEESLEAVISVDPLMVERLLFETEKLPRSVPIRVAAWSDIERVLNHAEQESRERSRAVELEARQNAARITSKILEVLIAEAESYLQAQLEIAVDEKLYYSFPSNGSGRARGTIDSRARDTLLRGLDLLAEAGAQLFRKDATLIERLELSVEQGEGGTRYELRWKAPWIAALPAPEVETQNLPAAVVVPFSEPMHAALEGVVLVIDDNATFAKVLEKFLKKQGLRTRHFEDGREAVSLLKSGEFRPDVIICDVHMPGFRGEEFLRAVRVEAALEYIPIIILTSDSDPELEIQLVQTGADAFVTKDEDPRLLAAQVQRLIRRSGRRAAA